MQALFGEQQKPADWLTILKVYHGQPNVLAMDTAAVMTAVVAAPANTTEGVAVTPLLAKMQPADWL